MNDQPQKKFGKIFVIESKGNFEALKGLSDTILFLTTGMERLEDLPLELAHKLIDLNFDPTLDAIVPVGRTSTNFYVGYLIAKMQQMFTTSTDSEIVKINVGIFNPQLGKESGTWYQWIQI